VSARDVTFVVYGAIGLALVVVQATSRRRSSLTLGQATGHLMRRRVVRVIVLLGWAWLGWHLFVRGSASFLN
jgi:D-alanyl-lipoteichoic acid acyltransferase DltB (MBOAT superfamily)